MKAIVVEDILEKPRVVQGLRDGHAFVYVAAWDRGDAVSNELTDTLSKKGVQVEEGPVVFVGADRLGRMLRAFPSLIAKHLWLPDQLVPLDEWSTYSALSNPFRADEGVARKE